jgi:tRNA threonylcarbamoyladenosine biosynthesis protein TsaB
MHTDAAPRADALSPRAEGRELGSASLSPSRRWLALDASGPGVSLALVEGSAVLTYIGWAEPRTAGTRLVAWVADAVAAFGLPDAVVAGVGPGSFTGVRVAVAAAKTLAWAWSVPLYGVSSLAAQAAAVDVAGTTVIASTERRGDHVYLGVYWRGASGAEALVPDSPWTLPAVPRAFDHGRPVTVTGPLADDAAWVRQVGPDVVVRPWVPVALGLVRVAQMPNQTPVPVFGLTPEYLRAPAITVRKG